MWWDRRSARNPQIHVHWEHGKGKNRISGECRVYIAMKKQNAYKIVAHVFYWCRLKAWRSVKASAPFHDEPANQSVLWACENPKRWKCLWAKYGRKRNYCAKHHICVTLYWRAPYSLAWQLGNCDCIVLFVVAIYLTHNMDWIPNSYYTLMIWFPELFYRFEEFEKEHPGQSASVCEVSSVNIENSNGYVRTCEPHNYFIFLIFRFDKFCLRRTLVQDFCSGPIDDSVYFHTIIIGLACIPTSFWLPLCVHRLGAKFFLGLYIVIVVWFECQSNYVFIIHFSVQFGRGWSCNHRTIFCA